MTHRLALALAPLIALTACAQDVAPGNGPADSAPPITDAAMSVTDSAVPPRDAEPPPHELMVAVLDDANGAFRPSAGARGRAENARGQVVETVADAMGVLHFALDVAQGPWDVTAATIDAASHRSTAFSILDVVGPITGSVHLHLPVAPSTHPIENHRLTATVRGLASMRDTVRLTGPGVEPGTFPATSSTFDTQFSRPSSDAIVQPYAIETDGTHLVNGARAAAQPAAMTDMSVIVDLPSPPRAIVRSDLVVNLPLASSPGVVAVIAGTNDTHLYQHVANGVGTFTDVGVSAVETLRPDAWRWHFERFDQDLAPDGAQVLIGVRRTDGFWLGGITVQRYEGAPLEVGAIRTLEAHGSSADDVAFSVDADGYTHALVSVVPEAMDATWSWYAATYAGAGLRARRLPHLPTGIAFDQTVTQRALVSVLRMGDGRGPWETSSAAAAAFPEVIMTTSPIALTPH